MSRLHKIYKKGNKLLEVTRFFMLWNWTFESKRVPSLWNKLSEDDKELIPFDLTSVDWVDANLECWKGTLKYALKDHASSEERFRKYIRYDKFNINKFLLMIKNFDFKL